MAQTDTFVPIDKLAEHLCVKVTTVRQWVKRGLIPRSAYLRIGNTYRFHIPEVVSALKKSSDHDTSFVTESTSGVDSTTPVQLELDFGTDPNADL